ncbi:MAG: hypothetical protein JRH20_09375, partial [Deltaproteobacteria bacterium]|nr:hypothetical protein [Deltaproteobacteria bacterium]
MAQGTNAEPSQRVGKEQKPSGDKPTPHTKKKKGDEPQQAGASAVSDEPSPSKGGSDEPAPPSKGGSDEPAPSSKGGSDEPDTPGMKTGGLDEPSAAEPGEPQAPVSPAVPKRRRAAKAPLKIGVGFHSRAMFMPSWLLSVGFNENTQMTSAAMGAEVVFRRGTFDIIGSIDFSFHSLDDGNFLGSGKNAATETDYLNFDNLNFVGFAVHFIKHHPVLPWMSIVWGGGVGLGVTLGSVYRVSAGRGCNAESAGNEALCMPDSPTWDPSDPSAWMDDPMNHGVDGDSCPADLRGQGLCDEYDNPKRFEDGDMWPVVPILHLLAGVDFKVSDHFSLRVDGGFRMLSFY